MAVISVENLSLKFRLYHHGTASAKERFANLLHFPKGNAWSDFWALKDVSLTLNQGERLGIIGGNGAGKSTLLKNICRIYEPTTGRIRVNGRIAPLLEVGAGFCPECTGRENIYFNGTVLGYSKPQLREMEQEIIAFAELQEFIDTPVKYYSTGMHMRLAFSLVTTVNPDILILDELFVGGDEAFVEQGKARMYDMMDRASSMILVSHDERLLRSLCNRFIWLDNGKIVGDGDVSVLDRYVHC